MHDRYDPWGRLPVQHTPEHVRLSEDGAPSDCPWPRCPNGVHGDVVETRVPPPKEPVTWGEEPKSFTLTERLFWERQEGWRPGGEAVWRWVRRTAKNSAKE